MPCVLTDDQLVANYFEAASTGANPKQAANWIMGDIAAYLNTKKLSITAIALNLGFWLNLLGGRRHLADNFCQSYLLKVAHKGIVERKGLIQI